MLHYIRKVKLRMCVKLATEASSQAAHRNSVRNNPVIQEMRWQLHWFGGGGHPVHLRLGSFLALSGVLMDRHTSFIAFRAL